MPARVGASGKLREQTRLADPRLTDQLDPYRRAPVELGDEPVEQRELRGAPDEMLGDGHSSLPSIVQASSECSTARATSTREETSSLWNTLRRCVSTVFGLRNSAAAISGLVLRSTTSRAISSSRAVSDATPVSSVLPGRLRRWIR